MSDRRKNRPRIKTEFVQIRCSPEDRRAWKRAARKAGMTLSNWITENNRRRIVADIRRHGR